MLSPLRYPGGKSKLFPFFVELIHINKLYDKTYAEPYAGGAGLALKLLAHGYVSKVELNDIDIAIASFWRSVLSKTDEFCALVENVDLSIDEWRRQKEIYSRGKEANELELGFSAYFLNRTSRSGIIEGSGPIGGYAQAGNWKIDARFNRNSQISQIQEISRFSSCISVSSEDAMVFIEEKILNPSYFTYLDPPYYVKGSKLYKNFYSHEDHKNISDILESKREGNWVLSYDYVDEIVDLYQMFSPTVYSLQYSAGANGTGREIMFTSDNLEMPHFPGFELAA